MDAKTIDKTLLAEIKPFVDSILKAYKDAESVGLVEKTITDTGDTVIRFAAAYPETVAEAIDHLTNVNIFQVTKEPGTDISFLMDPSFADGNIKPGISFTFNKAKGRQTTVEKQQAGRESRIVARQKAKEQNAIMELKHGNYLMFSQPELQDAFSSSRISKMGTLSRDFIDKETGLVRKSIFNKDEIEELNPFDIPYNTLILLNSIKGNTVENIQEDTIKHGEISFYVKGVLDTFTADPRMLVELDDQDQIAFDNKLDRKTAGELYLEKQFKPLEGYIGTTSNGSRYKVFNFVKYEFETDIMTIQLPYLDALWRETQQQYFIRQDNQDRAKNAGKDPKPQDLVPLEVNGFFKNKAYLADDITLEIAYYITNVLLTAGNKGKPKKTEFTYKTIINKCPRLKSKLEEIENNTELQNPAARYNDQLKKIAKAFDLILDPDKCDALNHYEFIDIQPTKINKAGKRVVIPPTKRLLDEKLTIVWRRKKGR